MKASHVAIGDEHRDADTDALAYTVEGVEHASGAVRAFVRYVDMGSGVRNWGNADDVPLRRPGLSKRESNQLGWADSQAEARQL